MGTEMVGVDPEVAFVLPSARSSSLSSKPTRYPAREGWTVKRCVRYGCAGSEKTVQEESRGQLSRGGRPWLAQRRLKTPLHR